jgi:hypothetical protein
MSEGTDKDRTTKILGTLTKMIEKEPFLTYGLEEQKEISNSEEISEQSTLDEEIESLQEETVNEINDFPDLQTEEQPEEKTIAEPCYVSISTNLPTNEELLEEFTIENDPLDEATLLDAKLLMIPAVLLKAEISLSSSKFSPPLLQQLSDIGFDVNLLETTLKSEQCYPLGQSILLKNTSGTSKLIELPFSCFNSWTLEIPDLKNASTSIPYEAGAYHEVPVSCELASTIETFENKCLLDSASEFGLLESLNKLIMEHHAFPSLESEDEEESQLLIAKMRKAEKKSSQRRKRNGSQ